MPQESHATDRNKQTAQVDNKLPRVWLCFIGVGVVLFCVLVGIYIFDRNPSKGLQFLAVNTLSLLVLVVITVQAYIYNEQRKLMNHQRVVMDEQLKVVQQTLTETMRPHVGVVVNLENGLFADLPIVVQIEFHNEGNSPTDIVGETNLVVSKAQGINRDFDGADPFEVSNVLPHKPSTVVVISKGTLTADQVQGIENGDLFFYFFGKGSYSGIGGPYPIEFSVAWIPKRDAFAHCIPQRMPVADPDPKPEQKQKAN